MRVKGIIKITLAIIVDFALVYGLFGIEAAGLVCGGIMLYAWLGEYTALMKDSAVKISSLNDYERMKLTRSFNTLVGDVQEKSAVDISGVKLHLIPSDQINAYAYGFHNIAVTRGALSVCDELTLNAVLSHEVSHILCMDAVFHRIVFANITLVIVGLIISSFAATSFMWIIFWVLCLFGICKGCVSIFLFSGISKMIKGMFELMQRFVLFAYQAIMGVVSRNSEFRADRYACSLGYGSQLNYFLSRFMEGQDSRKRTLRDILYAAHPDTYKRIERIEQENVQSYSTIEKRH